MTTKSINKMIVKAIIALPRIFLLAFGGSFFCAVCAARNGSGKQGVFF